MTPHAVHHGHTGSLHAARAEVLNGAYARKPERFVNRAPVPPELPVAAWINQPAAPKGGRRSLNSQTKCLTGLTGSGAACPQ